MFYLAVTGAEMANLPNLSEKTAYMACHFCPSTPGISNIPGKLPPNSLLLLDDSIPPAEHDARLVVSQLSQAAQRLGCAGVYLDFQRPGYPLLAQIAAEASKLSCPVAVSQLYSSGNRLPAVLPPPPLDIPLAAYLSPWQGRGIWLELALDAKQLTLTPKGCEESPLEAIQSQGFFDKKLCCRSSVRTEKNAAIFSLWRTYEDILALSRLAESLGVIHTLGLYRELKSHMQRRKPP